jgi:transcriptional regulator with XRE-family HTH domain
MTRFGKIISEGRRKLAISQKELASKVKKEDGAPISPQYLNDIEHDRRNPPSEFLIDQFARELRLPKDYLCLVAGTVPSEDLKELVSSDPVIVEDALNAFRRKLRQTKP